MSCQTCHRRNSKHLFSISGSAKGSPGSDATMWRIRTTWTSPTCSCVSSPRKALRGWPWRRCRWPVSTTRPKSSLGFYKLLLPTPASGDFRIHHLPHPHPFLPQSTLWINTNWS